METAAEVKKEPNDHKLVTVELDGNPKNVLKGKYLVKDFKIAVGALADYELDEVIDGIFKPLNDNDEIHIKGGEVFVSHVRQGGSS
jgi:hypothetical protein